jgi:predicted nucleic acid-binding protein
MHAATRGQEKRWADLLADKGTRSDNNGQFASPTREAAQAFPALCETIAITVPVGLEAELANIFDALDRPSGYWAFTPADCCPDNHFLRGDRAQARTLLTVSVHVAEAYGDLKAAMVAHYMPKASKAKPPGHLEDWINHATGKRLAVNENDLWICAQAFERDLHVLTCDQDFDRIREAEPRLNVNLLRAI